MLSRRQTLCATVALAIVLALPRVSGRDRKFIFVYANGGWDPTRVLADGFDHRGVAMEARAERARIGGLPFVDHPDRPSVRAFFQAHAARSLVLQGVWVRSIDHEVCARLTMAGEPIQNGLRVGVLADPAAAVEALSRNGSRYASLQARGDWDTHEQDDEGQSPLWESLFAGLLGLHGLLQATPGTHAPTLAGETLIVVLSEMGRTPGLNVRMGKDHWPYTSALLVGDGVVGGRSIGGWDRNWYGERAEGQVLSAESSGATLLALADVDPAAGALPIYEVMA